MNSIDGQQERVLRTFTALYSLRKDWGGALIVAAGLGPRGAALALASNIAGAVCLSVEDDPACIREAIRSGVCDFIVNTLDEALRTVKNEIRKRLPLSVGLQADPLLIFDELLERGVSPDLFATPADCAATSKAAKRFQALGASVIHLEGNEADEDVIHLDTQLGAFLKNHQWHLQSFLFETSSELRAFDARAMSFLNEDDQLRRMWLRAAPRILQRERPLRRVLWLTAEEKRTLEEMST